MTVKRNKRVNGSGITEQLVESITVTDPVGPADRSAIKEVLAGPSIIFEDGNGKRLTVALRRRFGPDAKVIEERALAVLSRTRHGKYPPDSPEGYAVRELELVRLIRSHIRAGDADAAAHDALKLGALIMQEDMKVAHEPAAMTGVKQRRNLDNIRERANDRAHAKAATEWSRWQAAADAAWAESAKSGRRLSKNAMAQHVRSKLHLAESIGAIARRLKKPQQAG